MRHHKRHIFAFVVVAAGVATLAISKGDPPPEASVPRPREITSHTIHSDSDLIEVSFQIPAPQLVASAQAPELSRVQIADAATLNVEGYPEVPFITQYIAIPHCDDLEFVATARGIELTHDVAIGRNVAASANRAPRDAAERKPYEPNIDYPATWARFVDIQYVRGQALARVELYPVRFNGHRRLISVPKEITIRLRPRNPSGPVAVHAGPLQPVLDALIPNVKGLAPAVSNNPRRRLTQSDGGHVFWCETDDDDWEAAADFVCDTAEADYLMIVADELVADAGKIALIQQLADWHAAYHGFNVAIVRMKQIDDPLLIFASGGTPGTPSIIREFLKDIYDRESALHMGDGRLGFVLLVGDAYNPNDEILIPSFYFAIGSSYHTENKNGSDTYYSLLTGMPFSSDELPDLLIGRLPIDADSEDWELENVVQKIQSYEPTPLLNGWSSKVLLMSGGDDSHFTFEGKGLSGFEAYFDAIEGTDEMGVRGFTQMHRLTPGNSNTTFSKEVCDEIADGYGLVGLFDHANPVNFSGAFYPLHYDTLANEYALAWPLVLSFGSHSGYFDRLPNTPGYSPAACCPSPEFTGGIPCQTPDTPIDNCDALTERLMVQSGGAIGVIAYSRTNEAVVVQRAFANAFRSMLQHNMGTFGAALVGTKLLTSDDVTTAALNLLGDPALSFQHQFDSVEGDSFDLVVHGPDIRFDTAVHGWCASGVQQTVSIVIGNEWKDPVEDVPVEVWNGDGGTGSTMLASFIIPSIAAYDTTVWTGSIGSLAVGDHDIYVMVDREHTLLEAAISNNVSFGTLHVRRYSAGFPIAVSGIPTSGITIADFALDSSEQLEILSPVSPYYYPVYSADGEFIAQSYGAISIPPAGNVLRSDKRHVVAWFDGFLGERQVNVFDAATGAVVSDDLHIPDKLKSSDQPPIIFDLGSPNSMLLAVRTQLEGAGLTTNIRAYYLSGAQKWVQPIGDLAHGTHNLTRFAMASADITGDGASDIVYAYVSDAADSVGVLNGVTGQRVWCVSPGDGDPQRLYVRIADLDDDGVNEILVNTLVGSELRLVCYEASGSQRWSVTVGESTVGSWWRFFSCSDVDDDGLKEVVFAEMDTLGVIEASGSSAAVDRSVVLTDGVFFSTPITIDIDNDGSQEIISLARMRNRYLSEYRVALLVYESDLSAAEASYDFPWVNPIDANADLVIEPAAGDIDNDGVFEVVFATPDSMLHAVDIGTSVGQARWSQVYGDAMHTGFPYELSLSGSYSGPVAVNHGARVLDDATFEGGFTVTAPSNVHVAEDAIITVESAFGIYGSQHDSVAVQISEGSPGGSSWQGFVVDELSTRGEIRCAVIADISVALESDSPVRIRNSRIVSIDNTACVSRDSLWLIDCTVLTPGANGVELTDGANGFIEGTMIANPDMVGIICDGCGSGTRIVETTVESAGDYGFHILSADGITIESCVAEDCGSAGIRFEAASAIIETSRFEDNPTGVACLDESSPTLAQSRILGSTVGVSAVYDSYPILGDGDSFPEVGGNNCIHNNSSHHVVNLSPGGTILARWNYWGQCCNAAKFSGSVTCSNCVSQSACSGAAAVQVLLGPSVSERGPPTPRSFELIDATPNPFNPITRIRFAVPAPGALVKITLFNVRGQRLATLQNGYLQPGYHDRYWEGRDERGVQAASGVYFVQMTAAGFQKSLKVVLLK